MAQVVRFKISHCQLFYFNIYKISSKVVYKIVFFKYNNFQKSLLDVAGILYLIFNISEVDTCAIITIDT